MRSRRLVLAALAGLLLGIGGCRENIYEQKQTAFTVGVVLKTMDSEHWKEIRSGMEHAASERGVRLILQYPSDEWATAEQNTMLLDMLRQPLDALVFAPCASDNTAEIVAQAQNADIPLFTVDTAATDTDVPYIGSDNRAIGGLAYQTLMKSLPAGSRIGIIAGTGKQRSIADRVSSLRFYCTRDQKLTVVDAAQDCKNYADAYHAARKQIEEQDVSAIFCTSAVIGLGAVGAKEEIGRSDVQIVAVDSQADAVNAVRTGTLNALISQSGYDIGYQAILWVCDFLDGTADTADRYLANTVLTAANVEAFVKAQEGEGQDAENFAGG